MKLRLPWALPIYGVVKGEFKSIPGAEVVNRSRKPGYFTKVRLTTIEELERFKTEAAARALEALFCLEPPQNWYEWDTAVWLHPDDFHPDRTTRPRALMIGYQVPLATSISYLAETWWIGEANRPICSLHFTETPGPEYHWYPGITSVDERGGFYVKSDLPLVNTGVAGMAYFDIISIDTVSLRCSSFGLSNFLEWACDRLRPGGVLLFRANPVDLGISDVRWMSHRFSDMTVLERVADLDKDCETIEAQITRSNRSHLTYVGVKRHEKERDDDQNRLLTMALELVDNKTNPNFGFTNVVITPPEWYPSSKTASVRRWTEYDDTKVVAKGDPLTVLVDSEQSIQDAMSKEYNYVKSEVLRPFGKPRISFGGGYDLEEVDPANLPALKKLCAEQGWTCAVKGAKATKKSEFTFTDNAVDLRRIPGQADPQILTGHINIEFMEQFCNEPPVITGAAIASFEAKQLVFPVAPGLANIMKLFGKLRPRVVQGKSGDYTLVGGTVEDFFTKVQGVDDKGKPMTTATSRKRAKLVSFKLSGPGKGDRYESVMG